MDPTPLITQVLKREGWDKYTNHPADRGGPTKWGITLKRWQEYVGHPVTEHDVKAISEVAARTFYLKEYIVDPNFDLIESDLIQELVVDCGVNHGTRRAARWLQTAAGVQADGVVGPKTLEKVNSMSVIDLFLRIIAYRIKLYGRLVSKDPSQAAFAAGWNNRAAQFLLNATEVLD